MTALRARARAAVRRVLEDAAQLVAQVAQLLSAESFLRPLETVHRGGAHPLVRLIRKALIDDTEDLSLE